MKITVLIPTANRPGMLRTALASVASQACLELVEQVVVSENAGNRESERVCSEFPELPIRYLFQEPQLKPAEHGYVLCTQHVGTPHMAMLFDDDWWSSGHLAAAANALTKHPDATAYFTACLLTGGEKCLRTAMTIPVVMRYAAGDPDPASLWRLSTAQVLAAAWVQTPFHFSSMVAATRAVQSAVEVSRTIPAWNNDRMFFCALAMAGETLYDPLLSTYVRMHGASDTSRHGRATRKRQAREGQDLIVGLAKKAGVDLAAFWRERYRAVPEDLRRPIFDMFNYSFGFQRMKELGLAGAFTESAAVWHGYRLVRKLQRTLGRE